MAHVAWCFVAYRIRNLFIGKVTKEQLEASVRSHHYVYVRNIDNTVMLRLHTSGLACEKMVHFRSDVSAFVFIRTSAEKDGNKKV